MKRGLVWAVLVLDLVALNPAAGQQVTTGGLVQEQELITLARNTPLDQAVRIIQTFANQVVVAPRDLTAPIGVDIDRVPWRQALARIAEYHGLQVVKRDKYIELLPGKEKVASSEVTLDSREVDISATFFQADKTALREIGIDWSTLRGGRVDASASHLGASQVISNQFSVEARANISRSLSVDMLLRSFESEQIGKILSSPQIKVRSGKTGFIQVGSDFSVTTADFSGNALTEFFKTGTILEVEAEVISQEGIDFVVLDVKAERSSLAGAGQNLINKTVSSTSVLLKDGEQTAIGGLYGQETTVTRTGIPGLKAIPGWFFGLRYLFGHDSKLVKDTELIVMIEVDIVPSVRQRVEAELRERESAGENSIDD